MSSLRARVPAALSLLLAAALVATAPSSHGDETPSSEPTVSGSAVVFPELTRINPDRTPYVIDVDAPAEAQVRWQWQGETRSATPGRVFLPLVDGDGRVHVSVCSATACDSFASPELSVRRAIGVETWGDLGPQRPWVDLWTSGTHQGDPLDVTWTLHDAAGSLVAEGRRALVAGPSQRLDLDLPDGLAAGQLRLDVRVAADAGTAGTLVGEQSRPVAYDDSVSVSLVAGRDQLYPMRDGHLDAVPVEATADPNLQSLRLEVLDATDTVVLGHAVDQHDGGYVSLRSFDGWTRTGMLPEGAYRLRLVATDWADNTASATTGPIDVRHEKLRWTSWRGTLSAADAAGSRSVGRCSSLLTPAPGRARGTLGYHASTRCTRLRDSVVSTGGGMTLPRSFGGQYDDLTISVTGGASRARPDSTLVALVRAPKKHRTVETHVSGPWGTRPVAVVGREAIFDRTSRRPYVSWAFGLAGDQRFDLGAVHVRLRYLALR